MLCITYNNWHALKIIAMPYHLKITMKTSIRAQHCGLAPYCPSTKGWIHGNGGWLQSPVLLSPQERMRLEKHPSPTPLPKSSHHPHFFVKNELKSLATPPLTAVMHDGERETGIYSQIIPMSKAIKSVPVLCYVTAFQWETLHEDLRLHFK